MGGLQYRFLIIGAGLMTVGVQCYDLYRLCSVLAGMTIGEKAQSRYDEKSRSDQNVQEVKNISLAILASHRQLLSRKKTHSLVRHFVTRHWAVGFSPCPVFV
jgi:hypothetical protein